MTWLRRNAGPIAGVLVASAMIIVVFELIDLLAAGGTPSSTEEAEGATLGPVGLIKVTVFMGVPFLVTLLVRRRSASAPAN